MDEHVRYIRASGSEWTVASAHEGAVVGRHLTERAAFVHARGDLIALGGGQIVINDAVGGEKHKRIIPPPPTYWFDAVVPYVLVLLPAALVFLFGEAAPQLFAPAILQSDGTVLGVGLATFVLAAGAAITVAYAIWADQSEHVNTLYVAVLALFAANLIAIPLGAGSLDIFSLRPDGMPMSGPAGMLSVVFLFIFAGILTYGIGGAVLGLIAGGLAGWRFAAWVLNR